MSTKEEKALQGDRRARVLAALDFYTWMELRDVAWKAGVSQLSARGHLGSLVKDGRAVEERQTTGGKITAQHWRGVR